MPTPEQNMQSVRTFAEEVFGNKNLEYAADWLADGFVEHQVFLSTTPDKQGAIDSYRIFFAASPDMTVEIHDMAAAGDKVAIRATYPAPTRADSSPACRPPARPSRWRPCIWSGSTTRDRSPSTGAWWTPSERWASLACCRPRVEPPLAGSDRYRCGRCPVYPGKPGSATVGGLSRTMEIVSNQIIWSGTMMKPAPS
jgi:predicted SnoaL-like aldol condensation-catalyzing enzyme